MIAIWSTGSGATDDDLAVMRRGLGADDIAVCNTAASDPGTWGPTGRLPGFPGSEAYPPQPMMDQIRKMLDDYAAAGGAYEEVAIPGCGHVPFITDIEAFDRAFHAHLARTS